VAGCLGPHSAKGFCELHYHRSLRKRGGDISKRINAPNGAGHVGKDGYRIVSMPGHACANRYGMAKEHRVIMSDSLGRALFPGEEVHHKNGNRSDNRLKKGHELGGCPPSCCNLELWAKSQPSGQRAEDLLGWAEHIVARYENLRRIAS
jgi:HNH endonuclease